MLHHFATIMVRPRETMRRILDDGPSRTWLLVMVLAAVSAGFGDFDRTGFENVVRAGKAHGMPAALVIAAILLAIVVSMCFLFYVFAWAAWAIGRVMEGSGTPQDVRRGVVWGLVPLVWALLYRVPIAFLWESPINAHVGGKDGKLTFDPGRFNNGCFFTIVVGVLELVLVAWCLFVCSNTVAEAHRFSSWRGLATIVLTSIAPLILLIAAVLAM